MFVHRLAEPIDYFNGLIPLSRWLADSTPARVHWALAAVLAIADAAPEVGWEGDMRHLPMVGGFPTPSGSTPYRLIKQDNNGDTFIVTDAESAWVGEPDLRAEVTPRAIGGWEPDEGDLDPMPAF
jgi:hypothetical protein